MFETFSEDTIYALATGFGKAAVAIIRISGQRSADILAHVCPQAVFPERRAVFTAIRDLSGAILDRGLVLRFPAPRSFTGEDMVEFQITGSRAVVAEVMEMLSSFPRTRPADAGEFARRAFKNGKLDLVEVEGLASVVEAETRAQLDHAMRMADGELSQRSEEVRGLLLRAMAVLESAIDFSDVEDAANFSIAQILPWVKQAHEMLADLMKNSTLSERLREGMTVVIAGPPNVGKSTLLNYLAKRDVAIVSPLPGTTRDSLEVAAVVAGYPVTFVDTAGIRETNDPIEALGIAHSRKWSKRADVILWLSDGHYAPLPEEFADRSILEVRTKADIVEQGFLTPGAIAISAKSGRGIDELILKVAEFAKEYFAGVGHVAFGTERQLRAARDAHSALRQILLEPARAEELIAESLRQAVHAMSRLTGRIEVEEVLGEIFSRLCVGK